MFHRTEDEVVRCEREHNHRECENHLRCGLEGPLAEDAERDEQSDAASEADDMQLGKRWPDDGRELVTRKRVSGGGGKDRSEENDATDPDNQGKKTKRARCEVHAVILDVVAADEALNALCHRRVGREECSEICSAEAWRIDVQVRDV